jgi:hypothetical protein
MLIGLSGHARLYELGTYNASSRERMLYYRKESQVCGIGLWHARATIAYNHISVFLE